MALAKAAITYGIQNLAGWKHLRDVENELSEYKKMYAELAHANYTLKNVIAKKL